MKKIGIYDPYLDDIGGGEKYMLSIAEALSQKYDVSVFWDKKDDFKKNQERFSLDLARVKVVKNIFSKNTSFVKRFFESGKYDGIIFLSDGSLPLLKCPVYVHMQRPLEHVPISRFSKYKQKKVRQFFVNSLYTKSFIDQHFHLNSQVIYPPVAIKSVKTKKENIILHVGRFRVVDKTVGIGDFKKQYVLINTFKELVDSGLKSWKLIMAVSVQDEDKKKFDEMKKTATGYPITFEVNKSNSSLWDYYSKAKIYWHASGYGEDLEKNPEAAEHFGISTVEAMGAGAVPVVINAGGQKEIVTDSENGLLWNTLPELKEVTLILINSKDLMHDLSIHAKTRAKDFSFEEFKKNILDMVAI